MKEQVKISIEFRGEKEDISDNVAVVITPSKALFTAYCDGYELLKLLAVLDSTMGDIIDRLKSVYHLSTNEICEHIYNLKEITEVKDQC